MSKALLAFKIFMVMLLRAPPETHPEETVASVYERYGAIATAFANEAVEHPLWGGVTWTAATMVGVTRSESDGWAADVCTGERRGDHGRSVTEFQLNIGHGRTPEGWNADELLADHAKAAESGLASIRRHLGACMKNPPETRLAAYASGSCDKALDNARMKHREIVRVWRMLGHD